MSARGDYNINLSSYLIPMFIFADADGVGLRIEKLLLCGDLEKIPEFSQQLELSVKDTARAFAHELRGEVLVAGGDDIMVRFDEELYDRQKVSEIARRFVEATDCYLSIGVASTPEGAYLNLRRSKSAGGNQGTDGKGSWKIHG